MSLSRGCVGERILQRRGRENVKIKVEIWGSGAECWIGAVTEDEVAEYEDLSDSEIQEEFFDRDELMAGLYLSMSNAQFIVRDADDEEKVLLEGYVSERMRDAGVHADMAWYENNSDNIVCVINWQKGVGVHVDIDLGESKGFDPQKLVFQREELPGMGEISDVCTEVIYDGKSHFLNLAYGVPKGTDAWFE